MIKSALLMLIFIYRFLWGFFSQRFSEWIYLYYCYLSLRKNFLYSKFFWSSFSHIWTEYGDLQSKSVFSPNAEKYGPEKLRIRTLFTLCIRFVSYLDLLSGFTAVALIVWCLIQEIWKISNKPLDRISCSCEHRSEGVLD